MRYTKTSNQEFISKIKVRGDLNPSRDVKQGLWGAPVYRESDPELDRQRKNGLSNTVPSEPSLRLSPTECASRPGHA